MKNYFLLFVLFCCSGLHAQTVINPDILIQRTDSALKAEAKKLSALKEEIKHLNDSIKHKTLSASVTTTTPCVNCEPGYMGYLLILLPVLLFLYLSLYFMRWLKFEKFKLSDALANDSPNSEFSITITTTPDPKDLTKQIVTETKEPNYSKSTSRLIAFLTAISSIVIALCLITFYAYGYVTKSGQMAGLDELWKIIAGLGIGVVPYVTKVIKEKQS
ncbi:MAG: hypothetical protein IT236_05995 [Bacteroidia bacterium]|nr:hypothetical protein [Bacteroidia bacterium]